MKKVLKKLFGRFVDDYFTNNACKKIRDLSPESKIYFFDIDNTIADTQGAKHLTLVNEFPYMINLVKEKGLQGKIFFLTARNITTFPSTMQWLLKKGFIKKEFELIFLTAPAKKIKILQTAATHGLDVEYYDDLCYNHENKEIKKYDDVIAEVSNLKIIYKGIDDFRHLQK